MEISTRNIAQIIRNWGGSRYVPLTKFLNKIGIEKNDSQVYVSIEENKIIITKDRIPDESQESFQPL